MLYAADLFDAATAQAIAARLAAGAGGGGCRPAGRGCSQVQVLEPAERAQIVRGWNDTAAQVPAVTLAELFAAQAAPDPGRGGGGRAGTWR